MEEVSRRIVPINDVGDDRASSYYLASSCTAAGGIDIVMSDGTVTWQGNLEEKDFTLPRGTARADFRARLLQGLSDGQQRPRRATARRAARLWVRRGRDEPTAPRIGMSASSASDAPETLCMVLYQPWAPLFVLARTDGQ